MKHIYVKPQHLIRALNVVYKTTWRSNQDCNGAKVTYCFFQTLQNLACNRGSAHEYMQCINAFTNGTITQRVKYLKIRDYSEKELVEDTHGTHLQKTT